MTTTLCTLCPEAGVYFSPLKAMVSRFAVLYLVITPPARVSAALALARGIQPSANNEAWALCQSLSETLDSMDTVAVHVTGHYELEDNIEDLERALKGRPGGLAGAGAGGHDFGEDEDSSAEDEEGDEAMLAHEGGGFGEFGGWDGGDEEYEEGDDDSDYEDGF
jgi:hypothetical protein